MRSVLRRPLVRKGTFVLALLSLGVVTAAGFIRQDPGEVKELAEFAILAVLATLWWGLEQ